MTGVPWELCKYCGAIVARVRAAFRTGGVTAIVIEEGLGHLALQSVIGGDAEVVSVSSPTNYRPHRCPRSRVRLP